MTHSRNSSTNPRTPLTTSFNISRRSSNDSPNSPSTSSLHRRPSSSHSRRSSSGYSPRLTRPGSGYFGSTAEVDLEDGGGGTLADELGGWDEGDEDEYDEDEEEYHEEEEEDEKHTGTRERDSGIDVASPLVNGKTKKTGLGIDEESKSQEEDTEEEESTDVDAEEMRLAAANLEARLAAVESLAKRGTGDRDDGQADDAIARATEKLKDLGLQSGIETGVTRLVTAHTAISTHLANQTRHLQHITTILLSPVYTHPISPEVVEDVLPAITSTLNFLPSLAPDPAPAEALHSLSQQTNSLLGALATVADTVNIVNGTPAVTATRRMRAVREVLTEIRTEGARRDDGVRYIEQGCWNQRLINRECASVCGEVLSGFEETCGRWRELLIRRSEAIASA